MAINRSAEAMTIFSVIQAGLFPLDPHGTYLDGILGYANSKPVRFTYGSTLTHLFFGMYLQSLPI
jgi:hypothetical protein